MFPCTHISSFHIHVYYDKSSKHIAEKLRQDHLKVQSNSGLFDIGKMHDEPVGPHTKSMFRIAVNYYVVQLFLSHLMLNRQGLSILIHPETGDDLKDHTEHAMWLGKPIELDLSKL